jgi:hypothetical protein
MASILAPGQELSERVEQLFYLRYNGPDACPRGYEEADGTEYASVPVLTDTSFWSTVD